MKRYRCANFEHLCANLGVTLIRAEPFTPTSKGKFERFFRSCRLRFLSTLDKEKVLDIDQLNDLFYQRLSADYNEKVHSALGMSPLDCFLAQASSINLPNDLSLFNEKFLVREARTLKHDATLSLNSTLYEASPEFAGRKPEIRYDPDMIKTGLEEVLLYDGNQYLELQERSIFPIMLS